MQCQIRRTRLTLLAIQVRERENKKRYSRSNTMQLYSRCCLMLAVVKPVTP